MLLALFKTVAGNHGRLSRRLVPAIRGSGARKASINKNLRLMCDDRGQQLSCAPAQVIVLK